MKTLIAVPCMDQVPMPFCKSLATLQKVGDCTLMMECGSLIYSSRDHLAKQAIKYEADYVFWLDSDMVFEPDTLARMMKTLDEHPEIDILSGLYFRRVAPYTPVVFDQMDIDDEEKAYFTEFKEIPDGLFPVGACGFGCVLMRAEVFLDIQARFERMFAPMAGNGEDIAFCWRARQCGLSIWCDPSIKLGHVGYSTVTREVYETFEQVRRKRDVGKTQNGDEDPHGGV